MDMWTCGGDTWALTRREPKRTYAYLIRSMRTLRFLLIARAGRLTRIGGRHVLRLSHNLAAESLYASVTQRLATSVIFGLGLTLSYFPVQKGPQRSAKDAR